MPLVQRLEAQVKALTAGHAKLLIQIRDVLIQLDPKEARDESQGGSVNHDLKIEPAYFQAVLEGRKTFEVRYNDRGFNAGDTVKLIEWNPYYACYTGMKLVKRIGYVSSFSQKENWVVFSLLDCEEPND